MTDNNINIKRQVISILNKHPDGIIYSELKRALLADINDQELLNIISSIIKEGKASCDKGQFCPE